MADALTAIPAVSQAFMQANPGATVAQQVAAGVVKQAGNTSVPNVGTNLPSPATTPATGFSSTAGASALADAQNTAAKLSPAGGLQTPYNNAQVPANSNGNGGVVQGAAPSGSTQSSNGNYVGPDGTQYASAPGGSSGASTTTPSTVTLVNKDTGQEYTLNNPTADQISSFKSNGWDVADGTGDGTGIIPKNTDPSIAAAQDATTQAKADVAAATAKLTNFNPTNDPVLQAQLASITSLWNQREQEMTNFNNSRVASTQTLGYRNGMQYTGGLGGTFGGIITAEEQQGVQRIGDLEAQKQQALSAATTAYSNQQWDRYAKLVDVAEQSYHDQVDQLNKLQTAAATASKNASDAATKAKEDYYTEVQKPIDDLVKTARDNNAPQDVLAKASGASSLSDAYSLLGAYSAGGTGMIGEYNYYKAQAVAAGQTPVDFNTYQNIDANRKAKATAAANGLNSGGADLTTLSTDAQKQLASSGFTKLSSGIQDLATQLVTGQLAPAELSKRTTGSTSYSDVLSAANAYSKATTGQPFNISKADRDYKYANTPATQSTLNFLSSLVGSKNSDGNFDGGNLGDLLTLSDSINRSQFPALNDATQWYKLSTGNPQIAAYYTTMLEVSDQVAKILQGGGSGSGTSDAKLAQAAGLFQKGFSKDQIRAVASSLQPLLANRAAGMIRDNVYLSDYASDFGIKQDLPGAPQSVGDQLVASETKAQNSLKLYATAHTGSQATLTTQMQSMEKTLGRPITATEFLQAFPEYAQ